MTHLRRRKCFTRSGLEQNVLIAVKKQANIAAGDGLLKWCLTRSFCN